MKKNILLSYLIMCLSLTVTAQQNVGFNHLAGNANVSIPLYTVGNVPIALSYTTRGVKVRDVGGLVGLGWSLNAGGSIIREIKGIPDDTPLKGWLFNEAQQRISDFSESYTSGCSSETDEYILLNKIYSLDDTQPDIFYINTPFVSGSFIFDTDPVRKPVPQPYQDLLIDYELEDSRIKSFTLTDEFGVVYEFSVVDQSNKIVVFEQPDIFFKRTQDSQIGLVNEIWHLSKIKQPNGDYINFNYTKLTPTQAITQKSLQEGPARGYKYTGSSEGTFGIPNVSTQSHVIKSIANGDGERVEFLVSTRNDGTIDNQLAKIEQYKWDKLVSAYSFYYTDVYPNNFQGWNPSTKQLEYEKRTFLQSIYPSYNGLVYAGFEFDYHGVYKKYNKLPSYMAAAKDFYGFYKQNGILDSPDGVIYYNPALDEPNKYRIEALPADHPSKPYEVILVNDLIPTIYYYPTLNEDNKYRVEPLPSGHVAKSSEIILGNNDLSVDITGLSYGSLSKLTYPTGGSTRFFYEANKYYDPVANTEYYGPGIRLRKTIVHDEVGNANNDVTDYSYDLENGTTSGVVVEQPVFAFSTPFSPKLGLTYDQIMALDTQSQAEALSIRTNFNMASGNTSVLYQRVTVSAKSRGSSVFSFDIPATIGKVSENGDEWARTPLEFARESSSSDCFEVGRFSKGVNVYPFADNPNYDFQRGLITSVKYFDEQHKPVSTKSYSYLRTNADIVDEIYGMTIDKIPTYKPSIGLPADTQFYKYFYTYGKYKLFSNMRNSVRTVTEVLYDPQDASKEFVKEISYSYGAKSKRLSEITATNSEGAITRHNVKYVADYEVGTSAPDLETKMIGLLKGTHQNGLQVESFNTITPPGGVEKLVSGSLLTFNNFDKSISHPYKQYALSKTGVIKKADFKPSRVNNGTFEKDPNYELINTMLTYDSNEKLSGSISKDRIEKGIHWGYFSNAVLAEISNAGAAHFLYSGFEEESQYDFSYPSSYTAQFFVEGHSGLKALAMRTGTAYALTGNMVKAEKTNKLIFSYWVSAPSAGSISYDIKSLDGNTTYFTASVNYLASSTWKYYETKIEASSLPETFKITLSSNAAVNIDDILLYPEESTVLYRSFGIKGELTSESVAGKTTTYYAYDEQLRNTLIRDDDQNILHKTDYTNVLVDRPVNPFFKYLGRNGSGVAIFELNDPQAVHDNYTWYFDDGPTGTPMTGQSRFYRNISTGIHTIRLTVSDGEETASSVQTIDLKNNQEAILCAAGPQKIDVCNSNVEVLFNDGCFNATGTQIAPSNFTIGDVTNFPDWNEQNLIYKWQVQHEGTLIWEDVGATASVSLMYDYTFDVRCILTIGNDSPLTIVSDSKRVVMYKDDPSCPDLSVR